MKKKSSILFLESPYGSIKPTITPVPFLEKQGENRVNLLLDLSRFSGQTLQVLEKSWNDFLASGDPLIVEPDPIPLPPLLNFDQLFNLLNTDQSLPNGDLSPYDQLYDWTGVAGIGGRYAALLNGIITGLDRENESVLYSAFSRLKQQTSQGLQQFTAEQITAIDEALTASNFAWQWADL